MPAKRRKAIGKMKRTTSKKTGKRLAAKKERLDKLAEKRAKNNNFKGCKNGRDAKKAKSKVTTKTKTKKSPVKKK